MKRTLLLWLLSFMLLIGCGAAEARTSEAQGSAPMEVQKEPSAEVPEVGQALPVTNFRYRVEISTCSYSANDDSGSLLATYQAQVPVMHVLQEDGTPLDEDSAAARTTPGQEALALAACFNRPFQPWLEEESFEELRTLAEGARRSGMGAPCQEEVSCTVYQTDRVISVTGEYFCFSGGAHGNIGQLAWNFDLSRGDFFDGDALCTDNGNLRKTVAEELLRQTRERAEQMDMPVDHVYNWDHEKALEDWDSYCVSFDESSMIVAYSPYELASFVAGPQVFRLDYDWLRPHLGERSCALLGLDE